jgi:hypothetical protein
LVALCQVIEQGVDRVARHRQFSVHNVWRVCCV